MNFLLKNKGIIKPFSSQNFIRNVPFYNENEMKSYIPITIHDLNKYKNIVIEDVIDHPCFTDKDYVKRKHYIQDISSKFNIGDEIPVIDYSENENKTWNYVTSKIFPKMKTNCCSEINENFNMFQNEINLSLEKIPQIKDISNLLQSKTGFTIMPVAGLLLPRIFLNALAFKVFASTQFIRPYEKCEFSGEPDVLHEILGHVSMLADKDFAEFSQEIGISSLGASDEDIKKLTNIYWFTVEYGLVYENEKNERKMKVYGGGITPSVKEIDYALSGKAKYWGLDFDKMQEAYYDYVNISTNYFVADSFQSMKEKFSEYSQNIKRNHSHVKFDKEKNMTVLH